MIESIKNSYKLDKQVEFLPVESGLVSQLGKRKYGFIHLKELDEGSYYLIGKIERENPLVTLGLAGAFVTADSTFIPTDHIGIVIEFEIKAGDINYIGEILTVSRDFIAIIA